MKKYKVSGMDSNYGWEEINMEKYRIELIKIGSYNSTIDNTDTRLTQEELTEFMDDWFSAEVVNNRDDYIMQLVDNETGEIICKAY